MERHGQDPKRIQRKLQILLLENVQMPNSLVKTSPTFRNDNENNSSKEIKEKTK